MKFQSDHSNTPLVQHFDGQEARIRLPSGEIQSQRSSFLLSAKSGSITPWEASRFGDLRAEHFAQITQLQPQVVIFGSGAKLRFAPPQLAASLMRARIGMETMDNHAACRTYNVLSAEGRDVLLALLIEPKDL